MRSLGGTGVFGVGGKSKMGNPGYKENQCDEAHRLERLPLGALPMHIKHTKEVRHEISHILLI
jgi:hypothetical protein